MNSKEMLALYRQMLVLRHFDEMCVPLTREDLIMNGFHPYAGQEAVAVGVCSVLNSDDVVLSTHRPQGHAIAKGCTPRSILAELMGRIGGVSQGIGGPMQFIDTPRNLFCGSIVGSNIPIAAGMALALRREGQGRIVACFFGDGASNSGAFHEGMNLAAIWGLPVLYILENNQYAEAMPVHEFVPVSPISKRAIAYGLEGVTVDGMDVLAVRAAVEKGAETARSGKGPVFIEMVTYRFGGHYSADPEHTYRTRDEVERWREKDPIVNLKKVLLQGGVAEDELEEMERQVVDALNADLAWVKEQPFPTVAQATDHVMVPLQGV